MTPKSSLNSEQITALFSRVAEHYDRLNRIMTFGLDGRWRRALACKGNYGEAGWVLDLGAGTGDLSLTIRKLHPKSPIVAVDISREMLAIASSKPGSASISWVIADVKKLPFADASIANTVSAFLVRNIPEIQELFREQHRVLQTQGRMTCLDTTPPRSGFLAPLQEFYFAYIVPLLGKIFANATDEYRYLADSTFEFLDTDKLTERITEAGFTHVTAETLGMGVVAIHSALKG